MQKLFIKNRKDQKIAVIVEEASNAKGLAFVMHGLGGYKEQPHIELFAKAFRENHYTTIRFDTTNSFGESDGEYEDATTTNYYEDLEDVIDRSSQQDFYLEPFALCGHSTGSMISLLYSAKFPQKVYAIAPISTNISGELEKQWYSKQKIMKKWERDGYIESIGFGGEVKRLKWNYLSDLLHYDLLKIADVYVMPILMIVGELDLPAPYHDQKLLFDKLPSKEKELHIIKGAPHTFREPIHLDQVYSILDQWIKKL